MAKARVIRDPVHNFVRLNWDEARLLDTPLLQRLRRIRQLAMADLLYPGAVHTRFEHSLGVCHVAGAMAEALRLDDDSVRTVRLAALLHDVGHGPFSHVSEHALERYADRATLPAAQKKEKIHELLTAQLILSDERIRKQLGESQCQVVAKLLVAGHGAPVLRSIVSGPLDADKQDYLLRDSTYCGVPYGVFDIHQFHRSLVLRGDRDFEKELMIAPDGVHAVEQYVLAKYNLTTLVYRHRVCLITDQMIVRAILLGVEKDGIEELARLYAFDNSPEFCRNYVEWDDWRFLYEFGLRSPATQCATLLQRLRDRRLLKRVLTQRPAHFAPEARETLMALARRENDALRADIEARIAEALSAATGLPVERDFVIVHAFDIKSVRTMSRNDEGSILVDCRPAPRPFTEESTLFRSIDESYNDVFVEVYAPVLWDDPARRAEILREVEPKIRTILESRCTNSGEGDPK